MKLLFLFILSLITLFSIAQKVDTITNQTIIQLYKAGLGKDVLNSKIQSTPCNFDVTTNGLISLKKAGIPDEVISTMMGKNSNSNSSSSNQSNNPTINQTANNVSSGIYYCKGTPCQLVELEASVYSQAKMGSGLMTSLTYGIAKTKMKATLGSENANLQIEEKKPTFYFYFDKSSSSNFGSNGAQTVWFSNATSPNEFLLVKFTLSNNKKTREVVTGSWNSYAGLSSGIDDTYKIQFKYEKVSPGVYRVYAEQPLEKGEYCFMYAGGGSAVNGTTPLQKVYDFGIKK
ncbi:MAG: hypothetical protein JWQ09_485 [Segetibacter sp.]|nr:hypothetical protein [Segetibacter sp.]